MHYVIKCLEEKLQIKNYIIFIRNHCIYLWNHSWIEYTIAKYIWTKLFKTPYRLKFVATEYFSSEQDKCPNSEWTAYRKNGKITESLNRLLIGSRSGGQGKNRNGKNNILKLRTQIEICCTPERSRKMDVKSTKKLEVFELWIFRRMLRIPWTVRVTNKKVLRRMGR